MSWQQIAIIIWYALIIGINLAKNGEPQRGKYSVWTAIVSVAVQALILYTGGFWK